MNPGLALGVVGASLLTVAMLFTAGWDLPPADTQQTGYRGTGMVVLQDREEQTALRAANQVPPVPWELDTSGQKASEVYENVQVLGDLGIDQFSRLMTAITEWVSPEQGCNYCHNPENMASDELYTKVVSRRMLEMTQAVNTEWDLHVQQTGVTCYTCHRGQPVPQNIWFRGGDPDDRFAMAGYSGGGQNTVGVGNTSLHADPFSELFSFDGVIGVTGPTALPTGHEVSIQQTEKTYALMVHMSQSLGANCTLCHNTRAFNDWNQSTPQRTVAIQGIQMVRTLNADYLEPLTSEFPPERLGPHEDVAKINCATCHQGAQKPLNGVSMVEDYPSLRPEQ